MKNERVREYPVDISPISRAVRRIQDVVHGEILMPQLFDISLTDVPLQTIYDETGEWLPDAAHVYKLHVGTYVNMFARKNQPLPWVMMNVIEHQDKTVSLYGGKMTCAVPIRNHVYELEYTTLHQDESTACISRATRLTHAISGIYNEEEILEQSKYESLKFDKKGYPKLIDWPATLLRYMSQLRDSTPSLTAEEIYRQPLVASRLKVEGINA